MVRQQVIAIYDYKDFIFASIRRELEITYLNSALGAVWTVIHPLVLITIHTLYAGFFKNHARPPADLRWPIRPQHLSVHRHLAMDPVF